jgi:hypothetical protein
MKERLDPRDSRQHPDMGTKIATPLFSSFGGVSEAPLTITPTNTTSIMKGIKPPSVRTSASRKLNRRVFYGTLYVCRCYDES